jgi:hypothetical protein
MRFIQLVLVLLLAFTPTLVAQDVDVSLFLVGDAGVGANPALDAFRVAVSSRVAEVGAEHVAVVFLGDNVYPSGVRVRGEGSHRLTAQVTAARAAGTIVFVPGNHDWAQGGREGLERIRNQQAALEALGVRLLPRNGCPGPEVVDVGARLRILAIDTQWWLHAPKKGGPEECTPGTREDSLRALTASISEERDTIVVAHHPMLSGGTHSRHSWSPQDQLHRTNRTMREQLQGAMRAAARPPLAFASGHEHTLEVLRGKSAAFLLVSGGGKYGDVERVTPFEAAEGTWLFGRERGVPQAGWMRIDFPRTGVPLLRVFEFREGVVTEALSLRLE